MQSIHHIIMRNRRFIGRRKELQAMERLLTAESEDWHILHFYGSAGMGKTVLLQQFLSMHEKDFPIIYIDGHSGFQSAQDLLIVIHNQLIDKQMIPASCAVSDVIDELENLARNHSVLALLLDGLDPCEEILRWLKDEFLNSLPINIRVYTAGRMPFDHWQTDYGFESIVRNIHLKPFSKTEWTHYAAVCGITDAQLLYQIGFISQGIPLAVSLLCNRILEQGNLNRLSEADYRSLMQLFDKHLLSEEKLDGVNSSLLSLASLTYTFDQELLEYMLEQPVSTKQFSQLCQSSFVSSHENGGWIVNNGMRWWVRTHLKERFPTAYEQYKQRAETMLERRLSQSNKNQIALKLELAIGKFYLRDSLFTRLVYFGNQHNVTVRAAKKEELPLLADMYQRNLQVSPPYLEDLTHQEQYFSAVWEVDSDAFQIMECEGQWLCFIARVHLTQEIRSILEHIPALQNWIHSNEYEQHDLLYWIISANQPTDWETIHFFLQQLFLPTLSARRVACQLIFPDQAEFLKLVGFETIPEADYVTDNGLRFYYCQMDCREFVQTSDALASTKKDALSIWITLTKKILTHYTELHRQLPLLEQCRLLWGIQLPDEEIIEHVHTMIDQQFQWLKGGTRQEKMQAQILQYAYMKKHGSHETVAVLLDFPPSTYYRQLKKLTHRIALSFQSHPFPVESATDQQAFR